ncbi:MAG: hypothetical protein O7D95_02260 [Betaproteobacteria bacterium]|nr:hypothetical protein [Betaproteobacteria bacterium]
MGDFTDEQLKDMEEAWLEIWPLAKTSFAEFKAKITKPKPVFKLNEIVVNGTGIVCRATGNPIYDTKIRHLLPEEIPAWEKDKKALDRAVNQLEYLAKINLPGCTEYAQTALNDIKELL